MRRTVPLLLLTACVPLRWPWDAANLTDLLQDIPAAGSDPVETFGAVALAACFDLAEPGTVTEATLAGAEEQLRRAIEAAGRKPDPDALSAMQGRLTGQREALHDHLLRNGRHPRFQASCAPVEQRVDALVTLAGATRAHAEGWLAAWEAVADSWDAATIRAFTASWPDPPYAEVAQMRLVTLDTEQSRVSELTRRLDASADVATSRATCDEARRLLPTLRGASNLAHTSALLDRCASLESTDRDLAAMEVAAAAADLERTWSMLLRTWRSAELPDLRDRAHAELIHQTASRLGCDGAEPTTRRLSPDPTTAILVSFEAFGGQPALEGFLRTPQAVETIATCAERDLELLGGVAHTRPYLVLGGDRPGLAVRLDLEDPVWDTRTLLSEAATVAPCHPLEITESWIDVAPASWWGEERFRDGTLTLTRHVLHDVDRGYAVTFDAAATAVGAAAPRPNDTHRQYAMDTLACTGWALQAIATPHPPLPPHPSPAATGLELHPSPWSDAEAQRRSEAAWALVQRVVVELHVDHSLWTANQYGAPVPARPARLASAKLELTSDRLLRNAWPTIFTLMHAEAPSVDRGATVLRRYVDGWTAW